MGFVFKICKNAALVVVKVSALTTLGTEADGPERGVNGAPASSTNSPRLIRSPGADHVLRGLWCGCA